MQNLLFIILDVVTLLLAIVYIFLASGLVSDFKYDPFVLERYDDNWNKGPIMEIETSDTACPEGFEPLISTDWPGNYEGCDCTSSEELEKKVTKGACTREQIYEKCDVIPSHSGSEVKYWMATNLCAKRMDKNFWKLAVHYEKCPENTKKCGKLESNDSLLCLPKESNCPVNELVISSTSPGSDYSSISLKGDRALYFTNKKTSGKVLVEAVVTSEDMCVNAAEGNLGENDYVLTRHKGPDSCKTTIEGSLTDKRFTLVSQEKESEFFEENGLQAYIDIMPGYPAVSDRRISLYSTNYFAWDKKCTDLKAKVTERFVSPNIDSTERGVKRFASFVWIYLFFVIVSVLLVKVILMQYKIEPRMFFTLEGINLAFLFIISVWGIVVYFSIRKVKGPYDNFIAHKCGDAVTDSVIEHTFDGIMSSTGYLIWIVLSAVVSMILVAVSMVLMVKESRKQGNYTGISMKVD